MKHQITLINPSGRQPNVSGTGAKDLPGLLKENMKIILILIVITGILFYLGADITKTISLVQCLSSTLPGNQESGQNQNDACNQLTQDNGWWKGILGLIVIILWLTFGAYLAFKIFDILL